MIDKEKDLAYLKFNLHEMKTHFNEKEDEVHSLKAINEELQSEMKFVKELNLQLKEEFDKEINVRRDNDKLMETKISSLEREVMETKNILIDTNKETSSLKSQLKNFNIDANEKFILCRKDIETVKTDISKTTNSSIIEDMGKLKDSVTNLQTEIRSTRSHLDESLNKKTDEMTKLTSHVENIENVLFCYEPHQDGCIKVKWVMQNYQYYFDIGKPVLSPVFYTHVSGYCFQLVVKWSGKKKEILGLYLALCRGKNNHRELKPFRVSHTLQILDKEGQEKCETTTLSLIDKNLDNCFIIHPNEEESRRIFGYPEMLFRSSLKNFIINDTLHISCVFQHSNFK